ncbi:hypothetical protein SATMO3_01230 [Sporomusa aerivorans]
MAEFSMEGFNRKRREIINSKRVEFLGWAADMDNA